MNSRTTLLLCAFAALVMTSCGGGEEQRKAVARTLAGYTLLDPAPEESTPMPNGTARYVVEGPEGVEVTSWDGKIFNVAITRPHEGGEGGIVGALEAAERNFGKPARREIGMTYYEDERTRVVLHMKRRSYTISMSDKELIEEALGDRAGELEVRHVIPAGEPVVIDGFLQMGEWRDAASFGFIEVGEDWPVSVLAKHDDEYLYLCFKEVKPDDDHEIYPEAVIDAGADKAQEMDSGDFWFHISYNDCDAEGSFDQWDCEPEKPGWRANNFPLQPGEVIEVAISFGKLGIESPSGARIGIAFAVSDTKGLRLFWPSQAKIDRPATWTTMTLQ